MRLLHRPADQPALSHLQRFFLADDANCRKRYQLAERLAACLTSTQVIGGHWLNEWAKARRIRLGA